MIHNNPIMKKDEHEKGCDTKYNLSFPSITKGFTKVNASQKSKPTVKVDPPRCGHPWPRSGLQMTK